QQHVARRLHHRQADREVDQVPARDDAVEADDEQPDRERVGEIAHPRLSRLATSSSPNSLKISTKAAETSSAVATFSNGMLPPEASVPAVPSGPKFCRNAPPSSIETTPITA